MKKIKVQGVDRDIWCVESMEDRGDGEKEITKTFFVDHNGKRLKLKAKWQVEDFSKLEEETGLNVHKEVEQAMAMVINRELEWLDANKTTI